jgi:chromate transporter
MTTADPTRTLASAPTPAFGEFFKVWLKIGCINFGGPAGQIAMMHRIVVDEKKWIDETRFLHALNFCMLLPGPEATKLATYVGWLLHGVRGGLVSGILFVLPGALVMLGLSLLYALGRGFPLVDGALFGIKAAVLVIVLEALIRIGKRALKTALLVGLSLAAFVGIFFLSLPFPLIVAAAALIGYLVAQRAPKQLGLAATVDIAPSSGGNFRRQFALASAIGLAAWWAPVALAAVMLGPAHVLVTIGTFFSKLAVVSFGGAYAVLAYMAQEAVETHQWMTAPEMVDGLGLAETTPGPLILVTQFVGFLAAFRRLRLSLRSWPAFSAQPLRPGSPSCRRCCGSLRARLSSSRCGPTGNYLARSPPSLRQWSASSSTSRSGSRCTCCLARCRSVRPAGCGGMPSIRWRSI